MSYIRCIQVGWCFQKIIIDVPHRISRQEYKQVCDQSSEISQDRDGMLCSPQPTVIPTCSKSLQHVEHVFQLIHVQHVR